MKKCKYCKDLNDLNFEAPEEIWKGETAMCDECGAEYYREYYGDDFASNKQAIINHPDLRTI